MTARYAAYGSNLSTSQMAFRCPDARIVGTSEIRGYRLLFKGSKTGRYATIEPCEDGCVPVLVWEISDSDERSLDRYEGYPRFYRKEEFALDVDGETVDAMAYVMDESRPFGIPSDFYYEVLAEGYEKFGFDAGILEAALLDSIESMQSRSRPA